MKFELTVYQADAAADVIAALQEGYSRFTKTGKLTAISLSAPTGAGKTVIATAVIERLMYGDEATEPTQELTVLWVTDDPSLNVQTKRKMLLSSSHIRPSQLVTVDATLDQSELAPATVYFVHIQQLSKGATSYTKVGNKRQYSLWDTIGNTIARRGHQLLLIVDEAHRGTSAKPGGAKTITAQLIDGAGGKFPPTPIVLGISATPQRFADAISKAGQRTLEPVTVDPEAVRASGLIKDKLRIKHPTEKQPGDATLLELAVGELRSYDSLWTQYSEEQKEPLVKPALVIQVRPKVSDSEIGSILDTLQSAWPLLSGPAVGHSFQEHTTLSIGARSVRYIAPQDIQDDPLLKVVLFKEALTTGWDCPRAEVMLSLRLAQDHTYIAQLIGRMVRTPLARRIATDDFLNSVALFLPYFNDDGIQSVVSELQSDDSQVTSDVEVNSIVCPRNSDIASAVWKAITGLPTYTRPQKHHRHEVARLNALATLLVGNNLDQNAIVSSRRHLVHTLTREASRLGVSLQETAAHMKSLQYRTHTIDLSTGAALTESASVAMNAENIDDLFRKAKRTLGDAAAKWYWDHLCDTGMDPDLAKVHVAALSTEESVRIALDSAAKSLIDAWRIEHNSSINKLGDAKRAQFYRIWEQGRAPEQVALIMPIQITAPPSKTMLEKHLYAAKGKFPAKLTGWELDVLTAELSTKSLAAWYRNPTGGTAAIAIPYTQSNLARTMYPDFLFFHKKGSDIVVDIVDPHRPSEGDAGPKWAGLSKFAQKHTGSFRRVIAVIKSPAGQLRSVDLKNPAVGMALEQAANPTDVTGVFDKFGGNY